MKISDLKKKRIEAVLDNIDKLNSMVMLFLFRVKIEGNVFLHPARPRPVQECVYLQTNHGWVMSDASINIKISGDRMFIAACGLIPILETDQKSALRVLSELKFSTFGTVSDLVLQNTKVITMNDVAWVNPASCGSGYLYSSSQQNHEVA